MPQFSFLDKEKNHHFLLYHYKVELVFFKFDRVKLKFFRSLLQK